MSNVLLIHSKAFFGREVPIAGASPRTFLKGAIRISTLVETGRSAPAHQPHLDGENLRRMGHRRGRPQKASKRSGRPVSDELIPRARGPRYDPCWRCTMYNFSNPLDPEVLDRSRGRPRPHFRYNPEEGAPGA